MFKARQFFPVVVEEPVLEDNVLNSSDDFIQSVNQEPEPVQPVLQSTTLEADVTTPTYEREIFSTDYISEMNDRSPNVISIPSPPPTDSGSFALLTSFAAASSIELMSSPTPTNVSSIRASFSRTPSPTYSNPTSGVSSTSYQLDQFERPASNQDSLSDGTTADQLSAEKFDSKSGASFQDLGQKVPVSEVDSSLIVFASKSKPKPAKQTVSICFLFNPKIPTKQDES